MKNLSNLLKKLENLPAGKLKKSRLGKPDVNKKILY